MLVKVCASMIRTNRLVSPKLFGTPISTGCVRNRGYYYPGERGLAAGDSLSLRCSERVTITFF